MKYLFSAFLILIFAGLHANAATSNQEDEFETLGWNLNYAQKCNWWGTHDFFASAKRTFDRKLKGEEYRSFFRGYGNFMNYKPNACSNTAKEDLTRYIKYWLNYANNQQAKSSTSKRTTTTSSNNSNIDLSNLSSKTLCQIAMTSGRRWSTVDSHQRYVEEAKRRGLTCGLTVKADKEDNKNKQQKPEERQPQDNGELLLAASGTGFVVSKDGHLITNHHVINGCEAIHIIEGGKKIDTTLLSFDKTNDLALLKAEIKPKQVFNFDSSQPQLLEEIYVAGYPFGLNISSSVKVTQGIVSSLSGVGNNYSNMQIDAAIQSGNSGGPIIDQFGNVIGVAVAKLDFKYMLENFGAIPENTNFGIKANVVENLLLSEGVPPLASSTEAVDRSEIASKILDATYYIACSMTKSKIEEMREQKVFFPEILK